MKTQREHEREEQQRIKNLVLNYDLRDEDQDGELNICPIPENTNIKKKDAGQDSKIIAPSIRPDKSSNNRSGQRARKLQLSDVDWYGRNPHPAIHPQDIVSSGRFPAGLPSKLCRPASMRHGSRRRKARGGHCYAPTHDQLAAMQKEKSPLAIPAPAHSADLSLPSSIHFPALPSTCGTIEH